MKSKTLQDKCICETCEHKFECFTQEKLFSDSLYQALYEAFMAEGMSKDEALVRMIDELRAALGAGKFYTWNSAGGSNNLRSTWYPETVISSTSISPSSPLSISPYFPADGATTTTTQDIYTYTSLLDGKEFKLICKES